MNPSHDQTSNGNMLRSFLLHPRREAPVVFWTVLLLVAVEFIAIVIAPLVVPDHVYLGRYLSDTAKENTAQFLNDEDEYMIRDDVVGWRNRPNSGKGMWAVDEHGSRTTHPFTTEPSKPFRVMILGSSLVNGGGHVTIDETITAQLEDSVIEALNFGTMLYALDQTFLEYKHELYRYNPQLLIVGISASPQEGLRNQYVPFRSPKEINMPYLKPRFRLASHKLELLPLPDREMHERILENDELMATLRNSDEFYSEFGTWKRFGFVPFSYGLWRTWVKARNFMRIIRDDPSENDLLKAIMTMMVSEARTHGAKVLFITLPDVPAISPGRIRRFLPDEYGRMVEDLKSSGYWVLDIRDTFRASGEGVRDLFWVDNYHFSPEGNRLIAQAIRREIDGHIPPEFAGTTNAADSALADR